jgi:hypothetical protein
MREEKRYVTSKYECFTYHIGNPNNLASPLIRLVVTLRQPAKLDSLLNSSDQSNLIARCFKQPSKFVSPIDSSSLLLRSSVFLVQTLLSAILSNQPFYYLAHPFGDGVQFQGLSGTHRDSSSQPAAYSGTAMSAQGKLSLAQSCSVLLSLAQSCSVLLSLAQSCSVSLSHSSSCLLMAPV